MGSKWTQQQEDYLINNYSNKTALVLGNELNKTRIAVKNKLKKLNLKLSLEEKNKRYEKRLQKFNIKEDFFINPKTDELFISGYLLGFLWSDGYIGKKNNFISLYIVDEDAVDIKHLFLKTGDWRFYYKFPKKGKPLVRIGANYKKLHVYLDKMDYKIKSQTSPYKVLENKDIEYIRGFWRGCLDGDGCYHFNPRTRKKCIHLYGTAEQDWTCYVNLLNDLNINYLIKRNKLRNVSTVAVTRAKCVLKLIEFIYPNKDYNIGLKRKFVKAKEMKSYIELLMHKNKHLYKNN